MVRNLRERDRRELSAVRFLDLDTAAGESALIADVCGRYGDFKWCAIKDGTPVALIGATPRLPGIWSLWAFGTDRWPEVVVTLSRHVKKFMIPAILAAGGKRGDCFAMETHEDARKWLTSLGAVEEAKLASWGKNGENFVCYAWLRSQLLEPPALV